MLLYNTKSTMHDTVWSQVVRTPKVMVDFIHTDLFERLPDMLIGLSIIIGGAFVAWLFIVIAEKLTGASSSKRKQKIYNGKYINSTKKSKNGVIRVVFISLAILVFVFGIAIGFSVAGVNFFSLAFGLSILMLILNAGFGTSIKSVFAFFLVSLTDKIENGWDVEIGSVKGSISAIHVLWTTIVSIETRTDRHTKETYMVMIETYIPTYYILDQIIKRAVDLDKIEQYNDSHYHNNNNIRCHLRSSNIV